MEIAHDPKRWGRFDWPAGGAAVAKQLESAAGLSGEMRRKAMSAPDERPKSVRKFVFDHFREHAVPPLLEQIMQRFSLSRAQADEVLHALQDAHHIALVRGTQRILMAFPFSAIPTPFRVSTKTGMRYYANCAWDAIAMHATLGVDIRVDSYCHHCAAPIRIDLQDGSVVEQTPEAVIVYLGLPAALWWDDIVLTCSNTMIFFASDEHQRAWGSCIPGEPGVLLSPQEVHEVGLPIYRTKMDLDYTRPSKQALLAHFAELGLTDDFWKL